MIRHFRKYLDLDNNVSREELENIIGLMKEPLARNEIRKAMDLALDEFTRIIKPLSAGKKEGDELSNRIIEEKGV